jgi:hypothetical protein
MPINPEDFTPNGKAAWYLAVGGYVMAALRYVFGAGSVSQRLRNVEKKVDEYGKTQLQMVSDVSEIKGELKRMNGKRGY